MRYQISIAAIAAVVIASAPTSAQATENIDTPNFIPELGLFLEDAPAETEETNGDPASFTFEALAIEVRQASLGSASETPAPEGSESPAPEETAEEADGNDEGAESGEPSEEPESDEAPDLEKASGSASPTVKLSGPVAKAYAAASGRLGKPKGSEFSVPGGRAQLFERGQIAYRGGASTAYVVADGIGERYSAVGGAKSAAIGLPVGNETAVKGRVGSVQKFQRGQIVWSPQTGSRVLSGGTLSAWEKAGGAAGRLGFPTREEYSVKGGRAVDFQYGHTVWSKSRGSYVLRGAIGQRWAKAKSALGVPYHGERGGLKNGGVYQTFAGGSIHWSSKSGARVTKGAIRDFWGKQKYENGKLGYPTSDEYGYKGGVAQNFQGGVVEWYSGKGASLRGSQTKHEKVVATAKKYLGSPYRSGGTTPSGWDCSGYTQYVYKKAVNITLPRTSGSQAAKGKKISKSQAKPGDLIYKPGHIGILAPGNKIMDAGSPRSGTSLRSYAWMGSVTYIRVNGM